MIIVMARRACSSLACLTSLTPPEQAARLNDKVVSANPSWFRAPRKIDTYFSLLRCSLKCDIINCSSSLFFFCFSFGDLRLWGAGVTEQSSLNVSDHQATASEVWILFDWREGAMDGNPGLSHCKRWKTERWRIRELGSLSALNNFHFHETLVDIRGLVTPTYNLSQPLTHGGTLTHSRQALCFTGIISLLVSWLYELQR